MEVFFGLSFVATRSSMVGGPGPTSLATIFLAQFGCLVIFSHVREFIPAEPPVEAAASLAPGPTPPLCPEVAPLLAPVVLPVSWLEPWPYCAAAALIGWLLHALVRVVVPVVASFAVG